MTETGTEYRYEPPAATYSYAPGWCRWCSKPETGQVTYHGGACPRVKAIDYYEDGQIRYVELNPGEPIDAASTTPLWPSAMSFFPNPGAAPAGLEWRWLDTNGVVQWDGLNGPTYQCGVCYSKTLTAAAPTAPMSSPPRKPPPPGTRCSSCGGVLA